MRILDDLISSLEVDGEEVKGVYTCAFLTAVVTRGCGLASTLIDPHPHDREKIVRDVGKLTEKGALGLAQYARSGILLEASIGMAAINSLLDVDEDKCTEVNAYDILAERSVGKKVTVVGHFPFVPRLNEKADELWVLEKRPQEGDLAAEEAKRVIPQSDVVAITGTSFINHTLDDLLNLCNKDSFVMLLGPTAPLSRVLFDYGIDIVCGSKVVDSEAFLRCICQGGSFRQIKGIKRLTMER